MRSPSSLFLTGLFGKPSSSGQISLKITRPTVVSMTFLLASPKLGLLAEIGIRQANPLVGRHRAVVVGENDFGLRAEQLQRLRIGRRRRARLGGQIDSSPA